MSVSTVLGRIFELKLMNKGYKKLTIIYNVPFKTKLLKFNIWDEEILKKEDMISFFKEGDEVKIEYTYKDSFPHLLSMERGLIERCYICHTFMEALDAQRMECEGCSCIPKEQHKIRFNAEMKLISLEPKQYMYSSGLRLDFLHEIEKRYYTYVIFENSFLDRIVPDLKVGENYFVVGWLSTQPGSYLDIVDITIVDPIPRQSARLKMRNNTQ